MGPGDEGDATEALPSQSLSTEGDSVKVFVRVRPVKNTGLCSDGGPGLCLSVLSPNTIRLSSKPEPKVFTFDHVADMDITQESVFSTVGRGIIESCMNGYNGTIFAYGQTGSGKTFTMLGPSKSDNFTHNLRGIIPRSLEYLFYLINREKEKGGGTRSFLCKCSFIEIYNEQIFDLLDAASSGLFLRESIKTGVFLEGVIEQVVTSAAEAYQVLSMGWRNRSVASTSMNRESSRSHAVFTLAIESKEKINSLVSIRMSRLNLVDLAGSERQKDTQAEGLRLKEASSINRSLSCLGNVIMGLVDVTNGKSRHIAYRDSKLTFLLKDSLGGNAKTYIIANVHPGSKCFGETLSTLQFARRAKLIRNKAIVNEDTQGNVHQLQLEIKRLKEQLSELSKGQIIQEAEARSETVPVTGHDGGWKDRFLQAMLLWEKSEYQNQTLMEKIGELKDVCSKKEKIIQSTKMIVKFREANIAYLEKILNSSHSNLSPDEKDAVIIELKKEVQILKEQTEQDSRIASYAMENRALREENKYLKSLENVKRAKEMSLQMTAKLERAFLEASTSEKNAGGQTLYTSPVKVENISAASQQRLKAQLLQAQNDLSSVKQEYEEFQQLAKKKQMELESEVHTLEKANQHLENILEATQSHKRQEVFQLNKMHAETIKNMTPIKSVGNLTPQIILQPSPDGAPEVCAEKDNAVINESLPLDMNGQAYEAIVEELRIVQEQLTDLQTKLDEEERKKVKLQQNIDKLESHSTKLNELLISERNDRNKTQQELITKTKSLESELQDCLTQNNILKSEVHDLRVVLQSADKELVTVKEEYSSYKAKQDAEHIQLSDQFMKIQLQLDEIRLEHEKNLEMKRSLQDSNDNLLEIVKFKEYENEQLLENLEQMKEEAETMRAEIGSLMEDLEAGKEQNQKLASQLQQDIENNSKELLKALSEKDLQKKESCELLLKFEQQVLEQKHLEQSLSDAKWIIADLEKKHTADQEVLRILNNQIQEMRSTCSQRSETVSALTQELEDIKLKYSAAVAAKEEHKTIIKKKEQEIKEMRETMERMKNSSKVEMEMLYEDLTNTYQQLEQQTEYCKELAAKLQLMQEEAEKSKRTIKELNSQTPCTPRSPAYPFRTPEQHQGQLDQNAIQASFEVLAEMELERESKNKQILQLKSQLHELKTRCLEMDALERRCQNLENCLERTEESSTMESQRLNELEKRLKEELNVKEALKEKLAHMETELTMNKTSLAPIQQTIKEYQIELERTRSLEVKTFNEKEEFRSALESANEEKEKLSWEVDTLQRQVAKLAEENGKLAGHKNLNQKIQYLVKVKKENAQLCEEVGLLKLELLKLKELKKIDINSLTQQTVLRNHDENVQQ
ncbi:kinesin-like protein KIF15 [Hypanus sabinus]|uniref:kinesin-like protein KIF15 n=1 Tax=Hypanus sabinus TaxID=79690 RepID=UPI0028C48AD1|nr:kinesin-like protein KIF15 [Hypanus sabinus]